MAVIANRLNSLLLVLVLLALLAIIGMLASGARGGPLDPPGAPGSTDSVRLPGTPISSLPFTISQSGSYYLTRNLASSTDGIIVAADHVTIDLMGFTLSGPGPASLRLGVADLGSPRFNVTVRSGTLRNWEAAIDLKASAAVNLSDLRVIQNQLGIRIGSGGILSRLLVRNNTGFGVEIVQSPNQYGTDLRDSNISMNQFGVVNHSNNLWIHDDIIEGNVNDGVTLFQNASWNKVTDCRINGNGRYGINIDNNVGLGQPNVNMVARNQIVGNGFGAVYDSGVGNRIGTFVGGDASITATNPWSNVVY